MSAALLAVGCGLDDSVNMNPPLSRSERTLLLLSVGRSVMVVVLTKRKDENKAKMCR